MKNFIVICALFVLAGYSAIGTSGDVNEIKARSPDEIAARGWDILRYEGYQFGSWGNHGGKVWYHVKDNGHKNTYYRVFVTLWGGELHFKYGAPENLHRINFDSSR